MSFDAYVGALLDSRQRIACLSVAPQRLRPRNSKGLKLRRGHVILPGMLAWRGSQVDEGARLESE